MTELRDEIAAIIEPHIAEDDWGDGLHNSLADRILAIPAIAEALALHEAGLKVRHGLYDENFLGQDVNARRIDGVRVKAGLSQPVTGAPPTQSDT